MSFRSEHQGARPLSVLLLTCLAIPLILAGICARSAAVGAAAVVAGADSEPLWKSYTAGSQVAEIEPERVVDGYLLWVATDGGIQVWQDSDSFWGITRTLTTVDGLPSNNVRDIAIDKQGNKWVATDGGVGLVLTGTWRIARQWTTVQGLADDDVYAIAIDDEGNRWFGTDGGISLWISGTERITSTCEGLYSCQVRDIVTDTEGYKWVATWGGGVSVIAPGRGLPTRTYLISDGLASNYVHTLLQDPSTPAYKWIGTSDGLSILDDGGDPERRFGNRWITHYLSECIGYPSVLSIAVNEAAPQTKWLGMVEQSFVVARDWDPFKSQYSKDDCPERVPIPEPGFLERDSISVIRARPNGNTRIWWLGTLGGGIHRYDEGAPVGNTRTPAPTRWASTPTPHGLRNDDVRKVAVDSEQRKWFGTWGGGYRVLDENREVWQGQALADGYVGDIAFEGSNVWMSMMQGSYLEPEGAGVYAASLDSALRATPEWLSYNVPLTVAAAVPFHAVQVIAIDPEGNKWFGTNSHGIAVLPSSGVITEWRVYALPSPTPTATFTKTPMPTQTGTRPIPLITATPTRPNTATATATGTLPTPTFTITPTPWLKSNWIRDIAVVTATRVTSSAAGVTMTEKYTEYWIATLGGGVNVTTTLKIDGKSKGWTSFGLADGLLSNDIWCVAVDGLGRRWLGTNRGISVMRDTVDGFEVLNYQKLLRVRDIAFDSSGRAWCATEGDGVYLLRLVGNVFDDPIQYTVAAGLASNIVWDVELENGEALTTEVKWFGTAHGVSRFAGATALPTDTPTPTITATRTGTPVTPTPTASATMAWRHLLPLILRST